VNRAHVLLRRCFSLLSLICVFGAFSTAMANNDRGPFLRKKSSVKIQTWLFYGQTQFSTLSNSTLGNGQFSIMSPGNRFEIEFFPGNNDLTDSIFTKVRFFADYEWVSFGTALNQSLNQLKFGLAASWWVFGNQQRFKLAGTSWMAIRKSELNLFFGPTVQRFSELQTSAQTNQIVSINHPLLVGLQLGARACVPLSNMTCIDISGRAIFPVLITNVLINSMNYNNGISYHWSAVLDHAFKTNFSIGAGVIGSLSRLDYVNKSDEEQITKVLIIAPTLSAQFRF